MYFIIALVVITSLVLFIQKVVMKGRLERGLGRKVTDEELTSLSAWMEATPTTASSPPIVNAAQSDAPIVPKVHSTPAYYDSSFTNSGVKWGKVVLFGFLVLVVAAGALVLYIYVSNNPIPPAGAFPDHVGRFTIGSSGPFYEYDSDIPNGKEFFSSYATENSGTTNTEVSYSVYKFPSANEAKRGLQSKKELAQQHDSVTRISTHDGKRIMQQDETRFVAISYTGKPSDGATEVAWVDGVLLKDVSARSQQLAYEFEGAIRNRPPAQIIPDPPDAPPKSSVYKFDKGGVQFDLPTGWKVEKDRYEDLVIKDEDAPDKPLLSIVSISKGVVSFEEVARAGLKPFRDRGVEITPVSAPVQDTLNGMAHTSQQFSGKFPHGDTFRVTLDVLDAGSKKVGTISANINGGLTSEAEGISNLIQSIKKIG